jgi:predicted acyltransferase
MSSVAEAAPTSKRVFSLDALRGFDMFWIIGGLPLVIAVVKIFCDPLPTWLSEQTQHAAWDGFTAWDMVMPLFLFVVGAAMPFAFAKRREEGQGILDMYWRVFRRVLVLWVLGMMVQGHLLNFDLFPVAFFSNTLQAIAVGYLFSAILLLHFPLVIQIVATALLLVGYCLLMCLVPFGQSEAGTLTPDSNLARYIDQTLLEQFRDLEAPTYTWILSSMAFVATVMLGVFGGRVLKASSSGLTKVGSLILLGGICLALGSLWSGGFEDWVKSLQGRAGFTLLGDWRCPCIKHIWSSSMVLWAAGWSYLLLAAFYLLLDVIKLRFLGWFFVVIGVNAIFTYVVWHLVSFPAIAQGTGGVVGFVGGLARYAATLKGQWGLSAQTWKAIGDAIVPCGAVLILWLILLYMYCKRTFVKV